ncbi:MAG TPA: DUF222 domain-containing protein, partial [Ilumatobacteraceae bacterium]
MGSIELPEVSDVRGLGPRQLEAVLRQVDMVRRQAEVLAAEIIAEAERSRAYREDGHRSVFAWARATCNWSHGTARSKVQTARLLEACHRVRAAAANAELGVDQLHVLAGLFANPRAREHFDGSAELLIGDAKGLWFDELMVVANRWEALADQDGAHAAHERAYAQRNARLSLVGAEAMLAAHGGALAGAEMVEIFERFCDAEFVADWEQGLANHGEAMCAALMARTAPQRRFDAVQAIFRAAAASGVIGDTDPTVNVVVDLPTFEHHLNRAAGVGVEPLDPATVHDRRCETDRGTQLDPGDVLAAALTGRV